MLQKFSNWFEELSKLGKTILVALSAIVLFSALGAGSSNTNKKPVDVTAVSTTTAAVEQVKQTPTPASKPKVEVKTETDTLPVPFGSTTVQNSSMLQGTSQITTQGIDGVKTLTYEVTYTDGLPGDKKLVKEEVTQQPVTQVTSVGTKQPQPAPSSSVGTGNSASCNPNYTPCIPNSPYDLDCSDIGFTVRVVGTDVYRLDRDHDGYGCE